MNIPQPIPFRRETVGAAYRAVHAVSAAFEAVVEPFGEACPLLLAMAAARRGARYRIAPVSDAHRLFWEALLHAPDSVADEYERLMQEAALCNRTEAFDCAERRYDNTCAPGAFLYLLLHSCRRGRMTPHGRMRIRQDFRRKGASSHLIRREVLAASALLRSNTRVARNSVEEVVAATTSNDLLCLDVTERSSTEWEAEVLPLLRIMEQRRHPVLLRHNHTAWNTLLRNDVPMLFSRSKTISESPSPGRSVLLFSDGLLERIGSSNTRRLMEMFWVGEPVDLPHSVTLPSLQPQIMTMIQPYLPA